MLSLNRKFEFEAELTLIKSKLLSKEIQPKDDKINWLFLMIDNKQYSFIYEIMNPSEATYNLPFRVRISFTALEMVYKVLLLNKNYKIFRGQEKIGTISFVKKLEN